MTSVQSGPADLLGPLPWQHALWQDLLGRLGSDRLGQALLFSGQRGIGKRHLARALIAYSLCEQRSVSAACGHCRSCLQLAVGGHPDAMVIGVNGLGGLALSEDGQHEQALIHWQPDKDSKRRDVSVDAARALIERLSLSAHNSTQHNARRMVLVEDADLLSSSAVNALLKTIEEPGARVHLLLVSERNQTLPATLRSRCQHLRLPLPAREHALQWLRAQGVTDAADLLRWAHGAPLRARELAAGQGGALRQHWKSLWLAVAQRKKDPVTAAAEIDRDTIPEHLGWAWSWLAGVLREPLLNKSALAMESATVSAAQAMLDELTAALRATQRGANPAMVLEGALVLWLRHGRELLAAGEEKSS